MENIILKVYLQPKSSKNEIVSPYRDGIKVKVTAPPIEGKANDALIRFLAKEFRISPSCIEITKGHRSREKTLNISTSKSLTDILNPSKHLDFKG
ncbi:MAG: YggU family protein [Deltaproteobacteria bacterium]|nr:YggU family protein [Deltaproteobacteria bacterium]